MLGLAGEPAWAERISNPTAVFSGLDKISGKISTFEVPVGQSVKFGALTVTPKVCYSRSATEDPNTSGFVEVDEMTLKKQEQRIFTGWMFAASPGLNGVEHPVYDVWLTDCKGGKGTEPPPVAATTTTTPAKPAKGKSKPPRVPDDDALPPDVGDDDGGGFYNAPTDPNAPLD